MHITIYIHTYIHTYIIDEERTPRALQVGGEAPPPRAYATYPYLIRYACRARGRHRRTLAPTCRGAPYAGSIKAVLRPYSGSIKAFSRLY